MIKLIYELASIMIKLMDKKKHPENETTVYLKKSYQLK